MNFKEEYKGPLYLMSKIGDLIEKAIAKNF